MERKASAGIVIRRLLEDHREDIESTTNCLELQQNYNMSKVALSKSREPRNTISECL